MNRTNKKNGVSIENLLEPRADKKGRLFIKGTRISVHNVAIWWKMGINGDEIAYRWNLSLAGVYAALAFYFANRNKIDKEIADDEAISEKLEENFKRQKYKKMSREIV